MGGPDAERDVSIESGKRVLAALEKADGIEPTGHLVDRPDESTLRGYSADVIFPALHGPYGEGGVLQGTLETAGIPFVGSDASVSARAMDKCATKALLKDHGIPTAPWAEITAGSDCPLEPPLVLKPIAEGSSVDVRQCMTADELADARSALQGRYESLMVERYIDGREFTVGVVEGVLLPLIEIRSGTAFYDYEAKYQRDDTQYIFDPDLENGIEDAFKQHAGATWKRLGCRDVARIDFMMDDEGIWVLEVNTMPGFTDHSLVPMAAARMGIEMPELCGRLVRAAWRRNEDRVDSDAMAGT